MSPPDSPPPQFAPASEEELSRFLRENAAGERRSISPVGGRTALQFLGSRQPSKQFVSTSQLNRIIDYPVRDMTITAESGVRISELAGILAEEGQQLPIDITHAHRATLGGAIACNVSGPRRFSHGTLRDYLIGVSTVAADGRVFHAGGRVVKNVAGYDLCKLMTGSRGTLGVISQVTLKVKPLAESLEAVWASCESFDEIDNIVANLLNSGTRPLALEVLTPLAAEFIVADSRTQYPVDKPAIVVFYEGSSEEIFWQVARAREELSRFSTDTLEEVGAEYAQLLLDTLREFPDGGDVPLTFQANLLPSATLEFLAKCHAAGISAVAHAGNGIATGHFPEAFGSPESLHSILNDLAQFAHSRKGNLSLLQADAELRDVFDWWGITGSSIPVMKKIKQQLDPDRLLNPNAMPF
jgi:glycolate oxidase FAD binding subunit